MARRFTLEEVNEELLKNFSNVEMLEYEAMAKPCKIRIADEVREYTKALKIMSELRNLVAGKSKSLNFSKVKFSDEVAKIKEEIETELKEFYKLPALEEIINNLGNEFDLIELHRHYPNLKILTLSALMERFKYKNKVQINYKKINDNIFTYYEVVS